MTTDSVLLKSGNVRSDLNFLRSFKPIIHETEVVSLPIVKRPREPLYQPLFVLLCGLPGAGKTTFRNFILSQCMYRFNNDNCFSSDDFIDEIANRLDITYDESFDLTKSLATRVYHHSLQEALKSGKNIIVDRTNLTCKGRAKLMRQVPEKYNRIAVNISISEMERQRRLQNRPGKNIPNHVDNSMKEHYEPVSLSEAGFDQVLSTEQFIEKYTDEIN